MSFARRAFRRRRDYPCRQGTIALGFYLAIIIVLDGRAAIRNPAAGTLGSGPDVQVFVWGLRWWPYAIQHHLDPFTARTAWPPDGVSTLWTTTIPGLAFLAAPITLTAGPVAAWNALTLLAPASAAWAVYLLCVELDARQLPAFIGGLLFGLSAYEQSQGLAHLQLTACGAVPLIAREALRAQRGKSSRRSFVFRCAALIAAQALISIEVLVSAVLVALTVAVISMATGPRLRRSTLQVASGMGIAALISLPITGLLVLEMLRTAPPRALNPPQTYSLDVLNFVVPTRVEQLGGSWARPLSRHFSGNLSEQDGYLGLPLIAAAVAYLWTNRRRYIVRMFGSALGVALVASLGPRLHVAGQLTIALPGFAWNDVPLLRDAVPDRFVLYMALAGSVVVSLWLGQQSLSRRLRGCVAVLAVAALCPVITTTHWQDVPRETGAGIPANTTAISLPFWDVHDRGLQVQAESRMRFDLIDKWMQDTPPKLRLFARTPALYGRQALPGTLKPELCDHGISTAIIWPGAGSGNIALSLGRKAHPHVWPAVVNLRC